MHLVNGHTVSSNLDYLSGTDRLSQSEDRLGDNLQ